MNIMTYIFITIIGLIICYLLLYLLSYYTYWDSSFLSWVVIASISIYDYLLMIEYIIGL